MNNLTGPGDIKELKVYLVTFGLEQAILHLFFPFAELEEATSSSQIIIFKVGKMFSFSSSVGPQSVKEHQNKQLAERGMKGILLGSTNTAASILLGMPFPAGCLAERQPIRGVQAL